MYEIQFSLPTQLGNFLHIFWEKKTDFLGERAEIRPQNRPRKITDLELMDFSILTWDLINILSASPGPGPAIEFWNFTPLIVGLHHYFRKSWIHPCIYVMFNEGLSPFN